MKETNKFNFNILSWIIFILLSNFILSHYKKYLTLTIIIQKVTYINNI